MKSNPEHESVIPALKRIEGQVRGIQKMVEERKYCVDIINQMEAAIAALRRTEEEVLEKHLNMCVASAMKGRSELERANKIKEMIGLFGKLRK